MQAFPDAAKVSRATARHPQCLRQDTFVLYLMVEYSSFKSSRTTRRQRLVCSRTAILSDAFARQLPFDPRYKLSRCPVRSLVVPTVYIE